MDQTTSSELEQLAAVITSNHVRLLKNWRARVSRLASARGLSKPALTDHIPDFLKELTRTLLEVPEHARGCEIGLQTAPDHGIQRVQVGFDIEDVVNEYNILRDAIHDLADEKRLSVTGLSLRTLNCVIDGAIAMAVRSYAQESATEVQRRRDEYLSFVAHDLRTPLGAIAIAVELLEKSGASAQSGVQEKAFRSLHRNVHHLTVLTNNILDENAGLQSECGVQPVCRDIDLWPMVESLVHGLHPVAGSDGITIVNDVPDELWAYADATLLNRIFQNLLSNAIAHSPQGRIRIAARNIDTLGGVECEVSDTGCGIAEDKLPYVFDKYETGGENGEGLGLGLAICKAFAEAHGGTISVQSKPGEGTVFRFTLPGKSRG